MTFITQLTHHGMIYVPIGYSNPSLFSQELHGGSPYGAGTHAGGDGSRQPSALELNVAQHEGRHFAEIATQLKVGRHLTAKSA
jgi:NAD(P)H dehydrogenase (quinone)